MSEVKTRLVVATTNQGKLKEIAKMLEDFNVEVLSLADFSLPPVPETGASFAENAWLKANAVCQATGLTALADDSGLEVDALSGAPGVYSARYAGDEATDADNNAKLLAELREVPESVRGCRFVCALAVAAPGGAKLETEGVWKGRVLTAPAGQGGFGYDPLFFDEKLGLSAAQMGLELKNSRSHRGLALAELRRLWPEFEAGK